MGQPPSVVRPTPRRDLPFAQTSDVPPCWKSVSSPQRNPHKTSWRACTLLETGLAHDRDVGERNSVQTALRCTSLTCQEDQPRRPVALQEGHSATVQGMTLAEPSQRRVPTEWREHLHQNPPRFQHCHPSAWV